MSGKIHLVTPKAPNMPFCCFHLVKVNVNNSIIYNMTDFNDLKVIIRKRQLRLKDFCKSCIKNLREDLRMELMMLESI